MKKQSSKYIVIAIFAVMIVFSVILMGSVSINYNISDYLDESTETKISLNIMENDFGTTGNIQVMVEGITKDEAYEVMDVIKAVPDVLFVNFSANDINYYKDGNALFAVITRGDEYSSSAAEVLENIKAGLDDHYEGKTNYGGAVVEKIDMRNTMRSEIVIILVVAVILAMAIMLIMANSWLEPVVLLVSSGIAVLINMGTNVIFGEISYITNAVAAILQLALSVDYSIVLLHNFRAIKGDYEDKHDAMKKAVKVTFKPVLASAATTIAGLLALLFMTMKIGFDIGIVLTKGIIISMLTSLTLLPALLLIFDKIMQKLSKRDVVITGKFLCRIAFKGGKAIILVALALIMVCGGLQFSNSYSFTDTATPNENIENTFGSTNTVVVVYPHNNRDNWDSERDLHNKLQSFVDSKGNASYKGYTAYSSTVLEEYTVEMAASKLNIPISDARSLFAFYHSRNNDPEHRVITPIEFVDFAAKFLTPAEGEDYKYADENTVRTLQTLSVIYKIVNGTHTADEMYDLVSTGVMADTGLSLFQIRQMYGLYIWERYEEDAFDKSNVDFETMLNFMVKMTEDESGKTLMDEQTAADLTELATGLVDFKTQMNMTVNREEFKQFGKERFGDEAWVSGACDILFSACPKTNDRAKLVDILRLIDKISGMLDEETRMYIKNYTYVYDVIDDNCEYTEFLPIVEKVVLALTNETREINATETAVQQAYIMYFDSKGVIPNEKIRGIDFITFVNETIASNKTVAGNVSEESKLKLLDVIKVDKFVSSAEKYNYTDMTDLLNKLRAEVQSITPSSDPLSKEDVYAIYIQHVSEYEDGMTDKIIAIDLLNYVVESMNDPNHTLNKQLTDEYKAKVEERKQAIVNVESLFCGEKYNRILLSVDLPNEGVDSTAFVNYLLAAVKETFGPDAHVAGQMISTYELQETFEKDNQIITIFTIISIFLIIALIFKSASLPTVLVTVIQGAIWIAMSSTRITGNPVFFMSYIIATCILMGSTIDYGILMSTNYLDYRKTMDKKDALYTAVKSAIPTIFTSGIILIVCGFVVGLVASLKSISTVGFLLAIGTLVSVLMITLVLPSVLYCLDGFVLKLTYRKKTKEEKLARKEARKAKMEALKAKMSHKKSK